jgi:hypothetical protein
MKTVKVVMMHGLIYREKGRKNYRLYMVSKKHVRLCNKETKRNES